VTAAVSPNSAMSKLSSSHTWPTRTTCWMLSVLEAWHRHK
jgi:hypothetical protein